MMFVRKLVGIDVSDPAPALYLHYIRYDIPVRQISQDHSLIIVIDEVLSSELHSSLTGL